MGIISAFPSTSIAEGPFCDYLNVTVPKDHAGLLIDDLLGLLPAVGPYNESDDGLFAFTDPGTVRVIGTVKVKPRGKVLVVSASGGALSLLRARGLYSDYLSILGTYPHRVSMLHATADYVVQSPPSVVMAVKQAAQSGELALSRKRLDPSQCHYFLGSDSDGLETGTVYLGQRQNADVWAKVYDKRHERLSRGFSDPGPFVRVEVAVQSGMGATLRDAFNPRSLFFHFAGRTLVQLPADHQPWQAHGEGYFLPPKQDRTAAQRIASMVEHSRDIGRLIDVAVAEYGEAAAEVIAREIRLRISRRPVEVG